MNSVYCRITPYTLHISQPTANKINLCVVAYLPRTYLAEVDRLNPDSVFLANYYEIT